MDDDPRTLADFVKTGVKLTPEDFASDMKMDLDELGGEDAAYFWVYAKDSYFIEEERNPVMPEVEVYVLSFSNQQYCGSREEMEARLFFDYYVSELVDRDTWTEDQLSALIEDYAVWKKLEAPGAQQMLEEARDEVARPQRDADTVRWLEWVIEVWDETRARESSAKPAI